MSSVSKIPNSELRIQISALRKRFQTLYLFLRVSISMSNCSSISQSQYVRQRESEMVNLVSKIYRQFRQYAYLLTNILTFY